MWNHCSYLLKVTVALFSPAIRPSICNLFWMNSPLLPLFCEHWRKLIKRLFFITSFQNTSLHSRSIALTKQPPVLYSHRRGGGHPLGLECFLCNTWAECTGCSRLWEDLHCMVKGKSLVKEGVVHIFLPLIKLFPLSPHNIKLESSPQM